VSAGAKTAAGCPLCESAGGTPVWSGPRFRVVRADEAGFPLFYRLVWQDHVAEFTDLARDDRVACMEAVATLEQAIRTHARPTKVNLASLGNAVPHLHWHVIARFEDDSRFPAPVWAPAARAISGAGLARQQALLPALDAAIAAALGT